MIRIGSTDGYSTIDLFGSTINAAAKISRYARLCQMVIGDELFWRLVDNDDFEFRLINRWDLTWKYSYPAYSVKLRQCCWQN